MSSHDTHEDVTPDITIHVPCSSAKNKAHPIRPYGQQHQDTNWKRNRCSGSRPELNLVIASKRQVLGSTRVLNY